jgi:hypothetical protein
MTYIRYWQAEGESIKTSVRICDAVKDSIRQGKWRGGHLPYGYKSVSCGTLNFKGKPIFDVIIDPYESDIIRTIFKLYTKEHYGATLIAKHLNNKGLRTTTNGLFSSGKVREILKNKIYIGIYQHNKYNIRRNKKKEVEIMESPIMKDFVIVDDASYYEAQEIITKNRRAKTNIQRKTVHGQLLSGMLFCGECGRRFTSHKYITQQKKEEGKLVNYFRCYYKCTSYYYPTEREHTCKQGTYNAVKLDRLLINDAKEFILTTDKDKLLSNYKTQVEEQLSLSTKNIKRVELDISKIDKEIIKLKNEVVKILTGESNFSQELLNALLQDKEQEKIALIPKQEQLQQEISQLEQNISIQAKLKENLDNWSTRFDNQTKEGKKAMLLNIIDKITLNNNKVEVEYKVQFNTPKILSQIEMPKENHPVLTNSTKTQDISTNPTQTPYFFDNSCVKEDASLELRNASGVAFKIC